jgi:hypothetical protein
VHYWNTKRQGFLPGYEGFSFEQCLRIADSGIFHGFCAKGHYFRVFGSNEFPNTFREKQDSQMQTQRNHRSTSTAIKSSLFIADIKHP